MDTPRQIVSKWRKRLPSRGFPASRRNHEAGDLPSFPPSVAVQVKALACELPHRLRLPLSRLSLSEIRREVITQGLVAEISGATLWRWLSADALRPWRHRSWIFPRDPDFAAKAGRILDLYARVWLGRPLHAREFVIAADEKSSIQARRRKQPTLPLAPGRSTRVEHEYFQSLKRTPPEAASLSAAVRGNRCSFSMDFHAQRFGSPLGENRKQTASFRSLTLFRQIRHRNS